MMKGFSLRKSFWTLTAMGAMILGALALMVPAQAEKTNPDPGPCWFASTEYCCEDDCYPSWDAETRDGGANALECSTILTNMLDDFGRRNCRTRSYRCWKNPRPGTLCHGYSDGEPSPKASSGK